GSPRGRTEFGENGVLKNRKVVPIHPFVYGMVARNPGLPAERAGPTEEDLRLIRILNVDEPYSALKCSKKYTLAVKAFALGGQIQSASGSSPLFNKSALPEIKEDHAAISAHNLAKLMRSWGMDAYVLNTKYCSYVTVGGFNDKNDRRVKQLQEDLPKLNDQLDPT